ncbi:MFS transporter [Acidicapsa acidisoli]|uniref:MFS transporter n=1 Tax=Acidicapsa acidisoli TaxID=1615681 RepID=UPI0021E0A7E1|nr:MFS transporter [Acidicapsa acidisoli]
MRLSSGQRRIFAITWITYAGFYLCRKNLSVVLPLLHNVSGLNGIDLANIVFGYSLLYAVGQFVWGPLSDRIGAKRVVGAGLLLVVACNLLMSMHASLIWLLILACLNGAGQSTGWSGLVKTMAIWFNGVNRGIVMAWWGTNFVLGGFLATTFATWAILQPWLLPELGWRRGFLFPALLLAAITGVFLIGAKETPEQADLPPGMQVELAEVSKVRSSWSILATLLCKPSLWLMSLSYFFLTLCRYALMFWLPLYMVKGLKYDLRTSGYVSSLYELIGILGALLAGYISDRMIQSRRAPVSAIMLAGFCIILLAEPAMSRYGLWGTALAISLAGIFSYGPDTLLSGAGAQDIGSAQGAATAAGLVDGIGHLGAVFSPYVVVYISEHYGWDHLFFVLAGAALVAGVALMPMWNLKPSSHSALELEDKVLQQVV